MITRCALIMLGIAVGMAVPRLVAPRLARAGRAFASKAGSPRVLVVHTTTSASSAEAAELADSLVRGRLAACVQTHPISSTYRWNGGVVTESEVSITAKTTEDRVEDLFAFIKSRHPYDTPELIAVPVLEGSEAYLSWVVEETRPGEDEDEERRERPDVPILDETEAGAEKATK